MKIVHVPAVHESGETHPMPLIVSHDDPSVDAATHDPALHAAPPKQMAVAEQGWPFMGIV